MSTSTNRNLQAKYEKARGQKVLAAQAEYSKPAYATPDNIRGVCFLHIPAVRVEQPVTFVVRTATIKRGTIGDGFLIDARVETKKPLRGKAAATARLRQHW